MSSKLTTWPRKSFLLCQVYSNAKNAFVFQNYRMIKKAIVLQDYSMTNKVMVLKAYQMTKLLKLNLQGIHLTEWQNIILNYCDLKIRCKSLSVPDTQTMTQIVQDFRRYQTNAVPKIKIEAKMKWLINYYLNHRSTIRGKCVFTILMVLCFSENLRSECDIK